MVAAALPHCLHCDDRRPAAACRRRRNGREPACRSVGSALLARSDSGRSGLRAGRRHRCVKRRAGPRVDRRIRRRRRASAPQARFPRRVFSRPRLRGWRHRGCLRERVLDGHNPPAFGGRWPRVVEHADVEPLVRSASSNGLHFLIAWEFFTLSAYFLITLEPRRAETRAAGWLYLAASHAATLASSLFSLRWRCGPVAGSWVRCEIGQSWRRCSGLPCLVWGEGGSFSPAHLAAVSARERAQPCFRDHFRRDHQDGHLRPGAFQLAGCRRRRAPVG